MKKLLILSFIFASCASFAQQLHLNTNYLFNPFLLNPGITGTAKDYIPIQINFRKQWAGFPGSPTTQSVSCHSEVHESFGFGGNVFNDNSGPSRRTGVNVSGSYHLKLTGDKSKMIGMGMGLSMTQHLIDVNQLNTYLPDDPTVMAGYNNQLVPDANIGFYYQWKPGAYVGLSAFNLLQDRRDLFDFEDRLNNPLVRTYYLMAGYDIDAEGEIDYKVATLIEAIETGTVQFDVSALAVYKNITWLGFGYRNLDAVSAMIGAQIGHVKLGYSYDFTLSQIRKYSSGSHEIFLELQLYNMPGGPSGRNWWKRSLRYAPKI